jgi:dephospho-CoA kinase
MKKVIIGLIGTEKSGRTTAAKMLEKKGFYHASINDKVAEFASHLFSKEELKRENNIIINKVRERGCSVNKEYWLNLVLVSAPDDTQYVVFDDISLDEVDNNKVMAYQIYRPGVSVEKLDDIETILNNGSLKDLASKIDAIHRKFTS